MDQLPTYAELPVSADAPPGSSWGLWGSQDQLGCLNKTTRQSVQRAASKVRDGEIFSLNASLAIFETPLFGRPGTVHEVVELDRGLVRDETLSSYNTQASSQWDGFRHAQSRGHGFYNGLPEDRVSISVWAERGIAGRGVLLDLESFRESAGRPLQFDEADPITVDDLRDCAAEQGIVIEQGDFLVIHTGWLDWARRTSPEGLPVDMRTPGLMPSRETVALLWDLQVAAVGSDVPAVEVWPPGAFASKERPIAAQAGSSHHGHDPARRQGTTTPSPRQRPVGVDLAALNQHSCARYQEQARYSDRFLSLSRSIGRIQYTHSARFDHSQGSGD